MKKHLYIVLVIVLIAIIGVSVFFGYGYFKEKEAVVKPTETTETSTTSYLPENPINFKKLKKQNADIFSWIKIDNTNIDYPILYPNDKSND